MSSIPAKTIKDFLQGRWLQGMTRHPSYNFPECVFLFFTVLIYTHEPTVPRVYEGPATLSALSTSGAQARLYLKSGDFCKGN